MKIKKIFIGIICFALIAVIIIVYKVNSIQYTKEFVYLPQYKNMLVNSYQPPKNEQIGNAVYKLQGVEYNQFLNNYEKELIKDGWQVTKDKKPESIEVTKGEHIARINAVNSKDYLTVLIWSK